MLVLADHSIFINRMILPRDTGNLEFTANCLHWLRGGAMSTADLIEATKGRGGLENSAASAPRRSSGTTARSARISTSP